MAFPVLLEPWEDISFLPTARNLYIIELCEQTYVDLPPPEYSVLKLYTIHLFPPLLLLEFQENTINYICQEKHAVAISMPCLLNLSKHSSFTR